MVMDTPKKELYKVMHAPMEEVIYYDENQEIFKSCRVDNMKTRWDYLADLGYKMTEIITFYHNNKAFIRIIISTHEPSSRGIRDISRIDFVLGKLTFGVSYIIPMNVWEKRSEEIKNIFN